MTSLWPAVVISLRSNSVLITPAPWTPRISMTSGAVTGCLYAITERVSNAARESFKGDLRLRTRLRTAS